MTAVQSTKLVGKNTTMEDLCLPVAQTVNLQTVTVYSIPMPVSKATHVRATFIAAKTDFSGNYGGYYQASFYRPAAGNVTKGGANITDLGGTIAGLTVDLVANTSTQAIDVKVTGTVNTTINWYVSLYLIYNT